MGIIKKIIFIGFIALIPLILVLAYGEYKLKCLEKAVLQWVSEILPFGV